jgi:hypothetical protein
MQYGILITMEKAYQLPHNPSMGETEGRREKGHRDTKRRKLRHKKCIRRINRHNLWLPAAPINVPQVRQQLSLRSSHSQAWDKEDYALGGLGSAAARHHPLTSAADVPHASSQKRKPRQRKQGNNIDVPARMMPGRLERPNTEEHWI